ncbi:hypothetical protein KIH86_01060 [Paenibacillus sp. HN-1]|uniref:hypothetical protein n=1 Tax=Paenibacillus TaxID=44249 RepID=UPI001CA8D54A|nr:MULTISPECIES: hypothetical protein [Paenibacillus]MBY9078530.1 hypothetical protein [Paenibacillus sp. CGMCC 1.18879]MBY9082823.1 hypothetical protein [Paenibacillus sinensis]
MDAYINCLRCKGQRVRVMTRDGRQYTGVVKDVDYNNLYLQTDRGDVNTSAFYPYGYSYGAASTVLTLSLFTLLAIALI